MKSIHSLIPDPETLLALQPEELAGIVLEYLNSRTPREYAQLNRYNFSLEGIEKEYPYQHQEAINHALMEAWNWLEREGLLALSPKSQEEWCFITRRGRELENATAVEAYRKANLLPKELLHTVIAHKVYPLFLRGEYDTAVFQAFKEVEVAVREAGSYEKKDFGVPLMRKAFHPDKGTLTDVNQLPAEKEAVSALFAGSIGLYKNPSSHKDIDVPAVEAAEAIIFASHLLKIVDSRKNVS